MLYTQRYSLYSVQLHEFSLSFVLNKNICSTHSWDHPTPAWPRLCPVGAVSVRLQLSSCLSTYRSWKLLDLVRSDAS